VRVGLLDLGDDDLVAGDAGLLDALDLDAGEGQQVVDFRDRLGLDRSRWVASQLRETFMGGRVSSGQ
jgi:hypothetical protein